MRQTLFDDADNRGVRLSKEAKTLKDKCCKEFRSLKQGYLFYLEDELRIKIPNKIEEMTKTWDQLNTKQKSLEYQLSSLKESSNENGLPVDTNSLIDDLLRRGSSDEGESDESEEISLDKLIEDLSSMECSGESTEMFFSDDVATRRSILQQKINDIIMRKTELNNAIKELYEDIHEDKKNHIMKYVNYIWKLGQELMASKTDEKVMQFQSSLYAKLEKDKPFIDADTNLRAIIVSCIYELDKLKTVVETEQGSPLVKNKDPGSIDPQKLSPRASTELGGFTQ